MSDRKVYMRELMRRKRANKTANKPDDIASFVSTQPVAGWSCKPCLPV